MSSVYDENYFLHRDRNIDKSEWRDIEKYIIGRTVLEVGCGTGQLVEYLTSRGFVAEGCDISEYAVSKARERGLNVINCNAEKLPYSSNSFDTVVSQHLLEHCPSDVDALLEMIRVARFRVINVLPGHWSDDPTHIRNHYTLEMILKLINNIKKRIEGLTFIILPDSHSLSHPHDWDWLLIVDLI